MANKFNIFESKFCDKDNIFKISYCKDNTIKYKKFTIDEIVKKIFSKLRGNIIGNLKYYINKEDCDIFSNFGEVKKKFPKTYMFIETIADDNTAYHICKADIAEFLNFYNILCKKKNYNNTISPEDICNIIVAYNNIQKYLDGINIKTEYNYKPIDFKRYEHVINELKEHIAYDKCLKNKIHKELSDIQSKYLY